MWYHIRYTSNWLLTAFLVIGLALLVLGTATIVMMGVGAVLSVTQYLLGYKPLLTSDTAGGPIAFGVAVGGIGVILAILGLNATDPKYLQQLRKWQK